MLVDRKYTGVITKANGQVVTDFIVFRAKDKLVPRMLDFYIADCEEAGSNEFHIEELKKLKQRVIQYQEKFGSKVPDTTENDIIFSALDKE